MSEEMFSKNNVYFYFLGLPGGSLSPVSSSLVTSAGGLLAEALRGFPLYTKPKKKDTDDLPLGATFKTTTSMTPKVSKVKDEVNIELDNAGRVKSGKGDFALFIKPKGKVKKADLLNAMKLFKVCFFFTISSEKGADVF